MGTLHRGILCDIADAAMGMSYIRLISPEESFTTIALKMNFLRPFWSGPLSARGKILRKGRTLGPLERRITDEKRRLVAYPTRTCMAIVGKRGEVLRALAELQTTVFPERPWEDTLLPEEVYQLWIYDVGVRPRDAVWAILHRHESSSFDQFGRTSPRGSYG
jgi:uncharacterized protein (TIGR00369 family)